MCAVSNVGDSWGDHFRRQLPQLIPLVPTMPYPSPFAPMVPAISREEFDALKRDVQEMKAALLKAKAEDERDGNPDCEMEAKVALLKQVAALVGVDLAEVFGGKDTP